jgi:hypothetical protein
MALMTTILPARLAAGRAEGGPSCPTFGHARPQVVLSPVATPSQRQHPASFGGRDDQCVARRPGEAQIGGKGARGKRIGSPGVPSASMTAIWSTSGNAA